MYNRVSCNLYTCIIQMKKYSNENHNNKKWFHFSIVSRFHVQIHPFTHSLSILNGTYFRHSNPIQIADTFNFIEYFSNGTLTNGFISNIFKTCQLRLLFDSDKNVSFAQTIRVSIFGYICSVNLTTIKKFICC